MVGVPGKKIPSSDAEWARSVEQRLAAIEAPNEAVGVGGWVLASSNTGELTATKPGQTVELTGEKTQAALAAETQPAAEVPQTMSARVTITTGTSGGTFTLSFESSKQLARGGAPDSTGNIAFNASAADVQAALVASGDYKTTDFVVYGKTGTVSTPSGPFVVVHLAGVLTANGENLTGVLPGVEVT